MKYNMKEAEKLMTDEIEAAGLKRVIQHLKGVEGRSTVVYLVPAIHDLRSPIEDMDPKAAGVAQCHWKDNFNYRKGRVLATARARRALKEGMWGYDGRTFFHGLKDERFQLLLEDLCRSVEPDDCPC
jgi:hypothetical protein